MEIIESKQREQLIQLYYASKCAKSKECLCKNNECNKYFFGHIMHCREKECTISQCISSRNIFSHFYEKYYTKKYVLVFLGKLKQNTPACGRGHAFAGHFMAAAAI